jgi:hypothetical protein
MRNPASKLILAATFVAASVCALAQAPDVLLDRYEAALNSGTPSAAALSENVTRLGNSLSAMPPTYWDMRPNAPRNRQNIVSRSMVYLNNVSRFAGNDPALGFALSNAYRSLGSFQESRAYGPWYDPLGAALSYQSSGLFLTQFANQNPNDPNVRGQLVFMAGRVRALGGTIPIWMNFPVGGNQQPQQQRGIPDRYTRPPAPTEEITPPPMPVVDTKSLTPEESAAYDTAMEKYLNASSSVTAAQSAINSIRSSVNSRGLSLASSYEKSSIRMRLSLDEAKRLIEQKQFTAAERMMVITEGEAKKALRELGQ